jgi:hypothetical protein
VPADLDALRITIKARRLLAHADRLSGRDLAELRQALARADRALQGPPALTQKSATGGVRIDRTCPSGWAEHGVCLTEAEARAFLRERDLM